MNIKQQALEAARPHADTIEDLIEKAYQIEAYLLGTTALTGLSNRPNPFDPASLAEDETTTAEPAFLGKMPINPEWGYNAADDKEFIGAIVDEKTKEPIDYNITDPNWRDRAHAFDKDGNDLIDDETADLIALARGLTSDLSEMGFASTNMASNNYRVQRAQAEARANERMKALVERIEQCDLGSAPLVPPPPNICDQRRMDNYRITQANSHEGLVDWKLRPIQLQIGEMFAKESVIMNVCRQFGSTTMIAAFARQQRTQGGYSIDPNPPKRLSNVLVLTNNHRAVAHLNNLIDDASVNVYSFNQISQMTHTGESYDYIIIDMAAFIPYAIEDKVRDYVEKCLAVDVVETTYTNARGVEGKREGPGRLIMVSVPGLAQGWFYEAYTRGDDVRKLAVDWKWSEMTAERAAELKKNIGEGSFACEYENKFRPVEHPSGSRDLTK